MGARCTPSHSIPALGKELHGLLTEKKREPLIPIRNCGGCGIHCWTPRLDTFAFSRVEAETLEQRCLGVSPAEVLNMLVFPQGGARHPYQHGKLILEGVRRRPDTISCTLTSAVTGLSPLCTHPCCTVRTCDLAPCARNHRSRCKRRPVHQGHVLALGITDTGIGGRANETKEADLFPASEQWEALADGCLEGRQREGAILVQRRCQRSAEKAEVTSALRLHGATNMYLSIYHRSAK